MQSNKQIVVNWESIGAYENRLEQSRPKKDDNKFLFAPEAKILVVDDNDMNRKVAFNLMKRNGIKPELSESGFDALKKIREKTYDIVFLDHMMPVMDGIETLEKIKEEHLLRQGMVIIALTANAVVGAKERYLDAGFDDYLSKPIEVEQLEDALAKYLPAGIIHYISDKEKKAAETSAKNPLSESLPEVSPAKQEDILEFSPSEDVLEWTPEDDNEENKDGKTDFSVLMEQMEKLGIKTETGLRYCAGDQDFYASMLKDYIQAYPDRSSELKKFYKDGTWKDYKTVIHALKSTSKTIGAEELFTRARDLEDAAGKEDTEFLAKNHEAFLKCYQKMTDKMKGYCEI